MPNLTTHIHFALLFAERTQVDIHLAALVEGSVAPGLHPKKNAFSNVHFPGMHHDIPTDTPFIHEEKKESDIDSFSFHLGYLSHFFLDHYFDAYRAEIFLFQSPLKEERMRKMSLAEQIDVMHMQEYETELQSLSEKYGKAFTDLYRSPSDDKCMEIAQDYEILMKEMIEKFTQFMKALRFPSDDFIL